MKIKWWRWAYLLAALVILVAVLIPRVFPAGEKDAEGALLRVLDGLRRSDVGTVREIVSPELDRTKLSEEWVAEFGGLEVTSSPSYGHTESDAAIPADLRGRVRGEQIKLAALVQRDQDGRWFLTAIARE